MGTDCKSALSYLRAFLHIRAIGFGKGRTISKTPTGGVNTLSELKGFGFTDDVASKIITKNKSLNLSDAEIKTLMQDLKNNSNLMKTVSQNPENGIDAWKIFTDNKKAFCE